MAKKFNITPKSLIDEVLWHEATSIRDDEPYLADVLVKLKLIEPILEGRLRKNFLSLKKWAMTSAF